MKARLLAFVILSAVGITYISASYLGFVDKILGRGYTIEATLPGSGGLFEGSMVSYRGVKVGEVSSVKPTAEGIRLRLALEEGTKVPVDSKMYVHNLSAVGEQYLDFEPTGSGGPYAEAGDVLVGDDASLPVDEGDLLVELDRFVGSVNHAALRTSVRELGAMFEGTGPDLQRLLDSGSQFVDTAAEHTDETVALLNNARTVLKTQQETGSDIRGFARDLNGLTDALRRSDTNLRRVLSDTPGAARELDALLRDLEPTIPILLANVISVEQVALAHMRGIEQVLVMFPYGIANGFGGIRGGYGQVNLQFSSDVKPCTQGYMPSEEWRSTQDLTDSPIYPAQCTALDQNYRGFQYRPGGAHNRATPRVGSYDPMTGDTSSLITSGGYPVTLGDPSDPTAGDNVWQSLLMGPVTGR